MSESNAQVDEQERRVAVRWTSTQQASCHFATLNDITCRWAQVVNVSADGIALILPCPFDNGQEVILELPCKDLTHARTASARVIHCKVHEPGSWAIGCEFDRPLTAEDMTTLV